ncbi:MAG: XdhC family protein [Xanthomonadales bacterium]|nr:XdhC family protein [Xanthomonadales bacterium]
MAQGPASVGAARSAPADGDSSATAFRASSVDPLRLLCERRAQGLRCCLVTIVGIEGTSPRRLGAQLVISEDGEVAGSISGGCLDASVAAEAMRCLEQARSQRVRYGAGSPYIDLTLPCGSGIDLQFDGALGADTVQCIGDDLAARRVVALTWPAEDQPPIVGERGAAGAIHVCVAPRLRVYVCGDGENLSAFCRVARASRIDVVALHPQADRNAGLRDLGVETHALQSPNVLPALAWDAFSAGLTLFHDHTWELPFLMQALRADALLVGAMGSQRAQALRVEQLRALGADESEILRLRGPVGLLPRARNPEELAISILGELIQSYRQQCVAHGIAV